MHRANAYYIKRITKYRSISSGLSNKRLQKIPRSQFSAMSMRAMTLFRVKPEEVKKATEIARDLEPSIVAVVNKVTGALPIEVSRGFRVPKRPVGQVGPVGAAGQD